MEKDTPMLMRPARKSDFNIILKLFEPWFVAHPSLERQFWNFLNGESVGNPAFSNVLELEGKIVCASFWKSGGLQEIELLALNTGADRHEEECAKRFLENEIVCCSRLNMDKICVNCPENLDKSIPALLRNVGFVFQSFSYGAQSKKNIVTLTKQLDHEVILKADILGFLKRKFQIFGYEIRKETDGFSYRTSDLYQRPFIVSRWHRIVFSETDLFVYPPAKRLEPYELETMFYPLRIVGHEEAPLLVTMDKKRACSLLSLPEEYSSQKSMFSPDSGPLVFPMALNNITYSIVSGHKGLRKGLPILFYVNGHGAAGEARIIDWAVETVSNLIQKIDDYPGIEIGDIDPKVSKTGSKVSQILKVRFSYYKAFSRIISFEEIRTLEPSFNPQRRRFVSNELFESISSRAYQQF